MRVRPAVSRLLLRRPTGDDGAGSVEYIGAILVVGALILSLVMGSTPVGALIAEKLCDAFGTSCAAGERDADGDRVPDQACTLGEDSENINANVTIAFIDLGADGTMTIEKMSDGTYKVTVGGEAGAAAVASAGEIRGRSADRRLRRRPRTDGRRPRGNLRRCRRGVRVQLQGRRRGLHGVRPPHDREERCQERGVGDQPGRRRGRRRDRVGHRQGDGVQLRPAAARLLVLRGGDLRGRQRPGRRHPRGRLRVRQPDDGSRCADQPRRPRTSRSTTR